MAVENCCRIELAESADDFLVRPGGWPETRYEAKARRKGHEVWYLRYRRN